MVKKFEYVCLERSVTAIQFKVILFDHLWEWTFPQPHSHWPEFELKFFLTEGNLFDFSHNQAVLVAHGGPTP